jgi:hypothetical protein
MSIFGNDKNKEPRGPRVERVDMTGVFDGYQHTSWDPYSLIRDEISSITLEASTHGDHLWTSSEALQMEAGSTWLAAARQAVGSELINAKDVQKMPKDVADMALKNYQSSRIWLEQHEAIALDQDHYALDTSSLAVAVQWPQPEVQALSQELLASSYETAKHLLFFYLPTLLQNLEMNVPYPAEYKKYDQQIARKVEAIQQRFQAVESNWNDKLHPNVAPGDQVYKAMTALIEDIIRLGMECMVPVVGNPFYKLAKKKPFSVDPTAFSPTQKQPPRPAAVEPSGPAFDPTRRHPSAPTTTPTPPPTIPGFDPQRFHHRQQPGTEATQERPAFDVSAYVRERLGTQAVAAAKEEKTGFDPASHRPPVEEPQEKPAFDPRRYRPTE